MNPDGQDLVSLADRLGALQLVRIGMALTVLAVAATDAHQIGLTGGGVAPLTAVYLLLAVGTEAARRLTRSRGLTVVGLMLLVDGVYLSALLTPVGGPRSVLIFLVYVHLISVTLLTSWRTGVKMAIWHSLLMVAGFSTQVQRAAARLLDVHGVVGIEAAHVVLGVVGFWVVGTCTAAFAHLAEGELRRGKAELGALASMGAAFDTVSQPQEIGAVLLEHVLAVFGFRRGAVIVDGAHGGWALRATSQARRQWVRTTGSAATVETAATIADVAADELTTRAWAGRGPVLARTVDAASPALAALLPGASNVVVMTLVADGLPVGVLAVERGGPPGTVIARSTVTALTSFATHAGLALRGAWLLAEVDRLARIDGLTGVANRRVFEAALRREVARAGRSDEPLSLVILDVDHFKRVNDDLGHQAGDDVLRHVGRTLAAEARETDLAARYGGEEFCVLLPGCPPEEAIVVAERLRAAIAELAEPTSVTASAGVASLPMHAVTGEALVSAADEALYQAKRRGRDRTCASSRRAGAKLSA